MTTDEIILDCFKHFWSCQSHITDQKSAKLWGQLSDFWIDNIFLSERKASQQAKIVGHFWGAARLCPGAFAVIAIHKLPSLYSAPTMQR